MSCQPTLWEKTVITWVRFLIKLKAIIFCGDLELQSYSLGGSQHDLTSIIKWNVPIHAFWPVLWEVESKFPNDRGWQLTRPDQLQEISAQNTNQWELSSMLQKLVFKDLCHWHTKRGSCQSFFWYDNDINLIRCVFVACNSVIDLWA